MPLKSATITMPLNLIFFVVREREMEKQNQEK
jgi:hypothetical protein